MSISRHDEDDLNALYCIAQELGDTSHDGDTIVAARAMQSQIEVVLRRNDAWECDHGCRGGQVDGHFGKRECPDEGCVLAHARAVEERDPS